MTPAAARLLRMVYAVYGQNKSVWSVTEYIQPDDLDYAAQCHKLLILMWDCAFWHANELSVQAGLGEIHGQFKVTSDRRVGDPRTHGESPKCLALDVRAKSSRLRYFILAGVQAVGFTRYSDVYEDGHIHADIGDFVKPDKYPPFVVWNPGDRGKWPPPQSFA